MNSGYETLKKRRFMIQGTMQCAAPE